MGGYVLGLDLGPSSVGWAAVKVDSKGNYVGLASLADGETQRPAVGSRIFEAGVEGLGQGHRKHPRNQDRRRNRSMRRRLRRARGRRLRVLSILQKHGMVPETPTDLAQLHTLDPYELRARALDAPLTRHELGRAILHLAKRRGFKSNRKKTEDAKEAGAIKEGTRRLQEELNGRTLGQFWYQRLQANPLESIRNKGDYHWVAQRSHYEDEFERIWAAQRKHHRDTLSDALHDALKVALFSQIRFELSARKRKKVTGHCTLMPNKPRASLALRKAQRFRMLQKVNDLRLTINGQLQPLSDEQRARLIEKLEGTGKLSFERVRKVLKLDETVKINFDYEGGDDLVGNQIDAQLLAKRRFDKKAWAKLDEDVKDCVWDKVKDFLNSGDEDSAEDLAQRLQHRFGLKTGDPEALASIAIPNTFLRYSNEVIDWLLPHLERGDSLYDAIENAGRAGAPFRRTWRVLPQLPPYDRAHGFHTPNPTVTATVTQVRKIINALIRELGKPDRIVIEFARELKASKTHRQDITRNIDKNRKAREAARRYAADLCRCSPAEVSPGDIDKVILWQQQRHLCPYSGRPITPAQLLNGNVEMDHILPRSLSLDNSLSNKVVCFAAENQAKGQRTPIDWLGEHPERWHRCQMAVAHWNPKYKDLASRQALPETWDPNLVPTEANERKWERFFVSATEIADKYTPERLLNETAYVAREVAAYLQRLYSHQVARRAVRTTKGPVTAELRRLWRLNRVLGDHAKKNRDDLRHHALDAAVVAVTEPRIIARITQTLARAEQERTRFRDIAIPMPWDGFAEDVGQALGGINVSHRPRRQVKGALHDATIYSLTKDGPYQGRFVCRVALPKLTAGQIESIADSTIRDIVRRRVEEHGGNLDKAFVQPLFLPNRNGPPTLIRKVKVVSANRPANMLRVREHAWVARVKDTHHIAVYDCGAGAKPRFVRAVCNRWDATQRVRRRESIVQRESPDHPNAHFVMSLAKDEVLEIDDGQGGRVLTRLTQLGTGEPADRADALDVHLWRIDVQNQKGRPTKATLGAWSVRSVADLMRLKPTKVTVDPLGRVRWAND